MAEIGVESQTNSCVNEVYWAIENHNTSKADSVLIIMGGLESKLSYNKKLIRPEIAKKSPDGFYFHLALCQTEQGLPKQIIDPSMRRPKLSSFEDYFTNMFSRIGGEEVALQYYTVPLVDFKRNISEAGINYFDPYQLTRNYIPHLTHI